MQDIVAVMDHLQIEKAHIVGLSMGGFAALHMGIYQASRVLSLVVAGCGYGAQPEKKEGFHAEVEAAAKMFEDLGSVEGAKKYTIGPTRVQFQNKDPRGFAEFATQMEGHPAIGSANTLRGVQKMRPSLWELIDGMRTITAPTLIITGDEDDPCLEPAILMKRNIPSASLVIFPKAGHTNNIEDPDLFNKNLSDFYFMILAGRWSLRDSRSLATGILGFK
jgi:pimeloyl-ACP methyl ester carboxylesterase